MQSNHIKYNCSINSSSQSSLKATTVRLQDVASIAGLLATTEAMVVDKPEEKDSAAKEIEGMGI